MAMATVTNPALDAFVQQIGNELRLAQVLIRRNSEGFELQHEADRDTAAPSLREIALKELRALAQFTAAGAFRPLKSAPNLQFGWRLLVADATELEGALDVLYPGAVADWFAAQSADPPVTHYREFTARQTGMYRITTMLTDAQAAGVMRACCHPSFCLKRRRWTVDGHAPDDDKEKSLIPCLEPCALLLEFARKSTRMEQEEKVKLELSPGEIATLSAALRTALEHPEPASREADFNSPNNPRRLRLLFEKLAAVPQPAVVAEDN
jgi:4Fe-4S binding protein/cobalt chelatase family protein